VSHRRNRGPGRLLGGGRCFRGRGRCSRFALGRTSHHSHAGHRSALATEHRRNFVGHFHLLLPGATGQELRADLRENVLEREFDLHLILVRHIREDARRRGSAEFPKTDLDTAAGQLGKQGLNRE
jgi:hypothetical protein